MRLNKAPKRSKAPGLTSLIDVIFLLLMFFMLASTFSIYQRLEVSTGKEGVGQMEQAPVLLRVLEKGQLAVGPHNLQTEGLINYLKATGIEKSRIIAILPGASSTVQDIVVVMDLLKREGWSATLVGK